MVTVWTLTMPVSAPNVTMMPGTAALLALSAVTVTFVMVELSDFTVVGEADSKSVAAVGVALALTIMLAVLVTPLVSVAVNVSVAGVAPPE